MTVRASRAATSLMALAWRRPIVRLFAAALALRVVLILLEYTMDLGDLVAPGSGPCGDSFRGLADACGYDYNGWKVAQSWQAGPGLGLMALTQNIHLGYHYLVALVYYAFGHQVRWVIQVLDSLAGAAAGVVIYCIGRRLYGERAALWAAGLCLFWPSLVFWSTQILKDPLVLLATAIAFWAVARLFEGADRWAGAVGLAAVLVLSTMRTYQALLLIAAALAGFLLSASVPARRRLAVCASALVLLAGLVILFRSAGNLQWNYFRHVDLRWLQYLRDLTTVGGSAFFVGADISSVPRLLEFLPRGVLATLLFPLPAMSGSVIYRAAAPEMVVWYVLLPFIFGGAWRALRARRGPELVLVFFAAGHLCALAVVQGNGGTLLRQRAPALMAGFLLASPGLADLVAWRARPYAVAKRAFDVVAAGIGSLLLLPLLAAITLGILLTDGRPIFYRQERLGQDKRRFGLLKFRTMVVGADRQQGEYSAEADPRITRIGRWLRRYSLDELPQLWNIVRGDMSLVGPRPMRPILYEQWSPLVDQRLTVRPGLTGWQQVNGRNSLTWEEMVALDAWYVDHASFWLDLKILRRTVGVVLGGKGLYFRSGANRRPDEPE